MPTRIRKQSVPKPLGEFERIEARAAVIGWRGIRRRGRKRSAVGSGQDGKGEGFFGFRHAWRFIVLLRGARAPVGRAGPHCLQAPLEAGGLRNARPWRRLAGGWPRDWVTGALAREFGPGRRRIGG